MSGRTNGRLRALIIEHERPTPAGFVYDWLAEHSADVDELKIDIEDREVDPRDYDLLVPLGSEHPPYADHIPWIPRELELLRRAHAADVSVLGICFGGQLLARALGSRCFRSDASEIGWLPVRSRDRALVPEGPWFQWHFDTFEPPPRPRRASSRASSISRPRTSSEATAFVSISPTAARSSTRAPAEPWSPASATACGRSSRRGQRRPSGSPISTTTTSRTSPRSG